MGEEERHSSRVTRSEELIARVMAEYPDGPPEVVAELVREYRIAVDQALRVEAVLHEFAKP